MAATSASATPSVEEKHASIDDALPAELETQALTRRETLSSYFTIICAGFALISDGYMYFSSFAAKGMY